MNKKKTKATEIKEAYAIAVSVLAETRNLHNAAAKAVKKAAQAVEDEEKTDG